MSEPEIRVFDDEDATAKAAAETLAEALCRAEEELNADEALRPASGGGG